MDSELLAKLERLAAAGVSILPIASLEHHLVFTRDGMAVLVERRGEGFGGIGSPGRITSNGFEPLVDDAGKAAFVFKGGRTEAQPQEADAARDLLRTLKAVLG